MITLSKFEWIPLQQRLVEEHGLSIMNISWACRRELGFTIRYHQQWVKEDDYDGHRETITCLDFYDDVKETFFRIKYL